jgi:dihydrofolate reductase
VGLVVPDEEVHAAVNETERSVGTQLLGRRMYGVLVAWETLELEGQPAEIVDWARLWRGLDKVVYSRTLREPRSARTRIERSFDPEAVRELKASSERDLSVGGPGLAAEAIRAGLVDELHLFVSPVVVGGGTPALPAVRWDLELLAERRFGNGVVHLRYRAR